MEEDSDGYDNAVRIKVATTPACIRITIFLVVFFVENLKNLPGDPTTKKSVSIEHLLNSSPARQS
jgi:hypothetical protein